MHDKLDSIDVQILLTLQKQGRTKRNELAEQVKLSIPAVSERLRKLEERGVIRGYHAVLDGRKVGYGLTAFIFLTCDSPSHYAKVLERATAHVEILECHAITGEGSHLLKVKTHSTETLEKLLAQIQSWPGVVNTRTHVVLSSPKEDTTISLKYLPGEGWKDS